MADELLTSKGLADCLRIKPETVALWTRRGKIPAKRLSKKVVRYRLTEVLEKLDNAAERTAQPADPK
jgi:hypothetical protein